MILVTGATGFIGRHLLAQIQQAGLPVRVLLRPSQHSPRLPHGMDFEVVVSTLNDRDGLAAAMRGVDVVYHLVGGEWSGAYTDLAAIDIQGTQAVARAAADAGVQRLVYVSHFGAERASAYPVLKSKGIAEAYIRQSGVPFTILRTSLVFGADDGFTTGLARLIAGLPLIFLLPGEGETLIQPLWVQDLTAAMVWMLDNPITVNQTYQIGGPEFLTFRQVVKLIASRLRLPRFLVNTPLPMLRAITVFFENLFLSLPVSVFWLDYLAVNRTASLDTLPKVFGVLPTPMMNALDYLEGVHWRREFWRTIFRRRK